MHRWIMGLCCLPEQLGCRRRWTTSGEGEPRAHRQRSVQPAAWCGDTVTRRESRGCLHIKLGPGWCGPSAQLLCCEFINLLSWSRVVSVVFTHTRPSGLCNLDCQAGDVHTDLSAQGKTAIWARSVRVEKARGVDAARAPPPLHARQAVPAGGIDQERTDSGRVGWVRPPAAAHRPAKSANIEWAAGGKPERGLQAVPV